MKPKLPALEKNILKYRALQMILLLHQAESLRALVIGSIRSTDSPPFAENEGRLPPGIKRPLEKALAVLVAEGILNAAESDDVQAIVELRNGVAHAIHELVADVSAPRSLGSKSPVYDYDALARIERYRKRITTGMMKRFVLQLNFRDLSFEQAEATYKEELARLRSRIDRQYAARRGADGRRARDRHKL
jgi:hypothetical protein